MRRRTTIVVVSTMALAGLGAIVIALRPAGGALETEFDATPAVGSTPPITVAPLTDEPTPDAEPFVTAAPAAPTPVSTSAPADTVPISPLAGLLGERGSAIPDDVEPRARPSAIAIGELDLLAPVRAVGLEPDGELEVPDETEVGWYVYGASAGQPGATVLAAHVTWNRTTGPFYRLRELDPGADVTVVLDDGRQRHYRVVERAIYDKDELPGDRIWRTTGDETLVLITCGGSFNPDIRRYRQNIVVYAVPVADQPADEPPTARP